MKIFRLFLDDSNRIAQRIGIDFYATKKKMKESDITIKVKETDCKNIDENTFLVKRGSIIEFH